MSIFASNTILKLRLAADSEKRKIDDKLASLGLTASQGRALGDSGDSFVTGDSFHPVDDEVEEKYNLSRVSEEEEIARYFKPFEK